MQKEIAWSELTHFNDKQKEAETAFELYKYLLYGGAMGGGKSYFLRWMAVKRLLKHYATTKMKGIRVGLFCEDYPTLEDRHLSKIDFEFPEWLGRLSKGDHNYTLAPQYGSGVISFRNLDDPSKYKSSEFADIFVDEITQNQKLKFDFLRTRMRWPQISDNKFAAATNPGGIGHAWVKAMWLDREFEATEKEADQFFYVRATAYDNRANLAASYFAQLEGLPPKLRQAYLEGDWNLFEGQFFSEWREDMHVVEPFKIPPTWRLFGGYDHGRSKPACFKWYAIDYDGNVWVYRELYVNKEDGSPRWEAEHIAREVLRLTTEAGERLEYVVADAAIFSQTGHGETIAEIFMKNGVGKSIGKVEWDDLNGHHEMAAGAIPLLIPSHKDRLAGWAIMHQYLAWSEESVPKMRYFSICRDSIRTIPALVYNDPTKIQSDRRLEDLNTTGEDHAADTDRYFLQTIRSKKTPQESTVEAKRSMEFKKRLGIHNDDPLKLSRFNNV